MRVSMFLSFVFLGSLIAGLLAFIGTKLNGIYKILNDRISAD